MTPDSAKIFLTESFFLDLEEFGETSMAVAGVALGTTPRMGLSEVEEMDMGLGETIRWDDPITKILTLASKTSKVTSTAAPSSETLGAVIEELRSRMETLENSSGKRSHADNWMMLRIREELDQANNIRKED